MASKVKVVDSNFRQVEVKVNPGTHLTEVLEQACAKLKADPGRHLLKHKQRPLDLSHTWRTSGLVQGAKLELVVKSGTPSAIDVALQLPSPESAAFPPHGRLTEKLPSDVTVWKLLRHFESGRPSEGKALNITGRGVPRTTTTENGSGQLYYETPVLQVDNRQLTTFVDFQKTLSQLGYNSGRVLIRLSFQQTDRTFVDAIADIDRYFKEEEQPQQQTTTQTPTTTESKATPPEPTAPSNERPSIAETTTTASAPHQSDSNTGDDTTTNTATTNQAPASGDLMDIDSPVLPPSEQQQQQQPQQQQQHQQQEGSQPPPSTTVRIFAAPASGTPAAARQAPAADEEDGDAFVPGIEHAKAHQRLLKAAGQNRRLPSDRELADRAAAERQRLAAAASVRIRVRLPDSSLLERDFGQADTGADLYAVVRAAMARPDAPFRLAIPPPGREVVRDARAVPSPAAEGRREGEGEGEDDRLIQGYRFRGQVVVTFVWDDGVPAEVRQAPFLKESEAARAQQVEIPEVPDVVEDAQGGAGGGGDKGADGDEQSSGGGGPKRGLDVLKGRTPKWLKGLGKK